MANNALVGYSPNDFSYVNASYGNCNANKPLGNVVGKTIGTTTITEASLSFTDPAWDTICDSKNHPLWFSDNSANCINVELCKNKANADKLLGLGSSGQGTKEKYMNEKMNYDNLLMNSINLGIGIVFLLFVIYKNQK
jgi:hypothetical protein